MLQRSHLLVAIGLFLITQTPHLFAQTGSNEAVEGNGLDKVISVDLKQAPTVSYQERCIESVRIPIESERIMIGPCSGADEAIGNGDWVLFRTRFSVGYVDKIKVRTMDICRNNEVVTDKIIAENRSEIIGPFDNGISRYKTSNTIDASDADKKCAATRRSYFPQGTTFESIFGSDVSSGTCYYDKGREDAYANASLSGYARDNCSPVSRFFSRGLIGFAICNSEIECTSVKF